MGGREVVPSRPALRFPASTLETLIYVRIRIIQATTAALVINSNGASRDV